VTENQLKYEFDHLVAKLANRDPGRYRALKGVKEIQPHPLFTVIQGQIESWEKY